MNNDQVILKFELLWPQYGSLWDVIVNRGQWTTEAFSAAIVAFLLLVFFIFMLRVFFGGMLSRSKIVFFERLLAGVRSEQLVEQRANLRDKAGKNPTLSDLWLEFDETLVISLDGKRLWNTVDAANFFNSHTLASGITESRLIAAVPGFLTAVGVIGTFAGLQLGLSGLNVGGSQSLGETANQIQLLIGSASIAFLTSVWGILTSVVFNFGEKYIEQLLRGRIARLQYLIDTIFPKIRPEQKLIEIEEHNRESRNSLQGLAEKIGDRMQETMLQMADNISESVSNSLAETLGPAVEKLVEAASELATRQTESSTKALEGLVSGFVDQVGQHAERQRKMMAQASQDIQNATSGMNSSLDSFIQKMEAQITDMRASQIGVMDSVKSTVTHHADETRRILVLGDELAKRVSDMGEELTRIGAELKESTTALQVATVNLDSVGGRMESATQHFTEVMIKAVETTTSYVEENKNLSEVISQSLNFLGAFEERTQGINKAVEGVAATVTQGLNQLHTEQAEFLAGMKNNLTSIQQQIGELMTEYGERVSGQTIERLTEWNDQTREFSVAMVSAVQAIRDVVEDIEDRVEAVSA